MRIVLAFDVGNSRVKGGLYVSGQIASRVEFDTDRSEDVAYLIDGLRDLFDTWPQIHACLIASVVREVNAPLKEAIQKIWDVDAQLVSSRDDLGIEVAVPRPEGVGIDRLLEASKAFDLLRSGVVVATMGSAVTIDLVDGSGQFRGGTILPGLRTGLRALYLETSLLPKVEVVVPDSVLGTDTTGCMQAGVVYGAVGAVERIYRELCGVAQDNALPLMLTGGDAKFVSPLLKIAHRVEADLVLRGLIALDARTA